MKTNECNHRVSFATSLLVTNPHNYPCPHCQERLTLDQTGRRYLWATVTFGGLYASAIGMLSLLSALQGASMGSIVTVNLIGFAFGPFLLLPLIYLGWKRSRFVERKQLERTRQATGEQVPSERPPFRYRLLLGSSK